MANKTKGERNRFYDGYELAKYRKFRGIKDSWVDYVAWLQNWGIMGNMIVSSPVRAAKAMWFYRWMGSYLGAANFVDRNLNDSEGISLKAGHEFMHIIMEANVGALSRMIKADNRFGKNKYSDKLVWLEEVMPPILMGGFPNLQSVTHEPFHVMMNLSIDQHADETFLDLVESYGLPGDACKVSSSIVGAAIDDELPQGGACIIISNSPCDSSTMNSQIVARRLKLPSLPGCVPMRWEDEDVHEYAVAHVKEVIKFIEDNTGETFNWESFYKTVEQYNKETENQLEMWELQKTPYFPASCVSAAMFRQFQWTFSCGTNPKVLRASNRVLEMARYCYDNKIISRNKTRHRAVLWGPAAVYYLHFTSWLYACWGITVVADMLNFCHHEKISTESKEEALLGVAKLLEQGSMRRHLVGGYNHMLECFEMAKQFDCDMIIVYDDITCKGGKSMNGIMQDMAVEHNIPLMWVSHDSYDPRAIPRSEMRRQVNDFMTTVMNDKPLDESLVDFNDEKGW